MAWDLLEDPQSKGEMLFVNPGIDLPPRGFDREGEFAEGLEGFGLEDAPDSSGADVIRTEFDAPMAGSVDKVQLDYDTGRIQVYDGRDSPAEYALAALSAGQNFSVIDADGKVSTSERREMSPPRYAAVTELLEDELREQAPETDRSSASFSMASPTDMYEEVMSEGEYETSDGEVVFDFESNEGDNRFEGDAGKARSLFEKLDEIGEFMKDYEQDYNPNDDSSNLLGSDSPDPPMRAKKNLYKFRVPDTSNDVSVVINQDYRDSGDKIEIDVEYFGDHKVIPDFI